MEGTVLHIGRGILAHGLKSQLAIDSMCIFAQRAKRVDGDPQPCIYQSQTDVHMLDALASLASRKR